MVEESRNSYEVILEKTTKSIEKFIETVLPDYDRDRVKFSDMKKMIKWCNRGPPLARVEKVEVIWEEPKGEFRNFHILW